MEHIEYEPLEEAERREYAERWTNGLDDPADATPRSRAKFWPELAQLPRPEYLVKGVLDAGCLAEIFGPTSCGKSFLATDLGLHIAEGWEWNGHRVRQAGVLYVSAEGGAAIINRLDAFQRRHGIDLDKTAFGVVLEPTNLLTAEGVNQVIADAKGVPDLRLIEIDTAARCMPGGAETTEDMSALVAACDRIRAEISAAILVVHHSGKDTSRGSRGSTVLPFGADTVIEVSRDPTTKIATATLNKQRDGATGPILNFNLKVIELGTDDDGDPITSCIVEPVDGPPVKSGSSITGQAKIALDLLVRAIADHGEKPPGSSHFPGGQTLVVRMGLWEGYLKAGGLSEADKPDTFKRAYRRVRERLINGRFIGVWNEYVWLADKPDNGRT